ncbi:hypothetical protein EDF36_3311 [Rathayibacter sp. PhB152]|uniref:hypothetical protein n=1 Tax=Rathayibacter sp. PhB152 TaxID=2485190 RepID=UPI000F4C91F9|nr:hypothetical protein [Rathayibacter sp. PhB152]ROQ54841.1 hypothetical protein EDF36_3311 [Rathayibacter sp. PhB152]
MLRIYLDQNKWVDLARAATGHRLGVQFVDALSEARAAVTSGRATFPLDMYRYVETGRRRDDRSRNDVAGVMAELSQQDTIARAHEVLPAEIDAALRRRFDHPTPPRQLAVFGRGLSHITAGAFSPPEFDLSRLLEDSASERPGAVAFAKRTYERLFEEGLLRTKLDDDSEAEAAERELGQRYVDHENSIRADLRHQGLTGDLLELAVRASDLGDIRPAVIEALARIDLTWKDLPATHLPSELVSFMDDLPTRYVTNVMRSSKLRQDEQKWEPNDFNDLLALPVAAVYCDVLVTEKQWIHRLRQGKIDKRFNTILLSSTSDLVEILQG